MLDASDNPSIFKAAAFAVLSTTLLASGLCLGIIASAQADQWLTTKAGIDSERHSAVKIAQCRSR